MRRVLECAVTLELYSVISVIKLYMHSILATTLYCPCMCVCVYVFVYVYHYVRVNGMWEKFGG